MYVWMYVCMCPLYVCMYVFMYVCVPCIYVCMNECVPYRGLTVKKYQGTGVSERIVCQEACHVCSSSKHSSQLKNTRAPAFQRELSARKPVTRAPVVNTVVN